MDIKKLHVYCTIIEKGSIAKAAELFNYSQPGMIYMINALEKEIGLPLLVRTHTGVHATPEGEALLPQIKRILQEDILLKETIDQLTDQKKINICIGMYPSIYRIWIPKILKDIRQIYPNLHFELKVGGPSDIENWLRNDEVDVCISTQFDIPESQWYPLYQDRRVAVLPKSYPFSKQKTVSLKELKQYPFLSPSLLGDSLVIAEQIHPLGIESAMVVDSMDDEGMIALIKQGMGYSILSALSLIGYEKEVQVKELEQPMERVIGIVASKGGGMKHSVQKFMSFLKQWIHRR